MILKKAIITNFRGISGAIEVDFADFNCIVGQNDAGKSTILKALDAFINETTLSKADHNLSPTENTIAIELHFKCSNNSYFLGEQIETTFEAEELVNDQDLLVVKKTWNVTDTSVSKPKMSIFRKKYADDADFVLKTENQLITLCRNSEIETTKGNGEEFNNVEKRQKLREYHAANGTEFTFEYEDLPSSGTGKAKMIADAIKDGLPAFQYFKADTSLSDTDSTIQKYFKDMAFKLIKEQIDTEEIETEIRDQLGGVLEKITSKINEVVKSSEKITPKVNFEWNKLISTSFVSDTTGTDLPLNSRGDGFRRITMMSYFEYLAENEKRNASQSIIFGFEEPETFLHPSAQEDLFDKLSSLSENGYQVVVSTHSPNIVGNTQKEKIIHISKPDNVYTINQSEVDYKELAIDLGIKPDNTFSPLFSTSRLLFLVEGIDDANAMHYMADQYRQNGLIEHTFQEVGISIIPIGGCGGVKHWVNLDLFTRLEKPFHIFLDSDKDNPADTSKNETDLLAYGLSQDDFSLTGKRMLENYIAPAALQRLVPAATLTYTDFCHVKNLCRDYPDSVVRGQLGGKKVAEKHFTSLTYDELRLTWFDGTEDEFVNLYNTITAKLN